MIEEISNFMDCLDPAFKTMGMKPKEGIHVLVSYQKEGDVVFMDTNSISKVCYTKNATEFEFPFLQRCAKLSQAGWCVNTNKCFDLPAKGIHSASPYCIAFKKESLEGGGKYDKDKVKIYDRVNAYFANGLELVEDDGERERLKIFQNFINSKEKLDNIFSFFQADFDALKDKEYIIFYLDEPIEKYQVVGEKYLADKLFNTNEYNITVGEEVFGTSDFLNGFPTKKPFLSHQSATFDIARRISGHVARNLFEFQDIMNRNILPRPLPVFINKEELMRDAIALFGQEAEDGKRLGYREIIEKLYEKYTDDLGNYYLLFFYGGMVKDFDFVSRFRYRLQDGWEIKDYFNTKKQWRINNVFELEIKLLQPIFNNALITQTKVGGFQYKYFDDIDANYCKSDCTYLLVMKYRKAFYDFIYKSKRQAVTQEMFDDILLTGILGDIRLDEYKNSQHSEQWNILQKLNIWYSLSENFRINSKKSDTMASELQEHRDFIIKLTKKETSIQNDDQYAFAVGQVVLYLLKKSRTADNSYKRLEPFLQQVHAKELNKAIARLFDMYKHENYSTNFQNPFAEVMAYKTEANMRDYMPTMLAGIFSDNKLFSKQEVEEVVENEE